jgi:uncharacterized membrane protein
MSTLARSATRYDDSGILPAAPLTTAAGGRADLRGTLLKQEIVMDHALDRPAAVPTPEVRRVETSQPIQWLRRGYADLVRSGWPSLTYGAAIALFGVILLALTWRANYLVPAALGGFLLVAPFAAIGLYALSAQLETQPRVDAAKALFSWRSNTGSIALFGLMLALSLILWERMAAIIFALYFIGAGPDLSSVVEGVLFAGDHLPLLVVFFGVGGLFAAMVFTLSVVSAPLLLDKPVDAITAAITSMRCCLANPGAMLLWALLIAGLTLIGFATAMLGLVVIFPWLAHASWHAYRDLVA